MNFEIIGEIKEMEAIAVAGKIRDIIRLRKQYVLPDGVNSKALPMSGFKMEISVKLSCIGMKHTASDERKLRLKGLGIKFMEKKNMEQRFVLCIENSDCEDLEKRKIYQVLTDDEAEKEGYLRVIDESGEDYLYPQSYFIFVQLPRKAQKALQTVK